MKVFDLVFSASFLYAIIRAATPLLLATMGSVLSTNAGTLNITLEGMMLMGALAGRPCQRSHTERHPGRFGRGMRLSAGGRIDGGNDLGAFPATLCCAA